MIHQCTRSPGRICFLFTSRKYQNRVAVGIASNDLEAWPDGLLRANRRLSAMASWTQSSGCPSGSLEPFARDVNWRAASRMEVLWFSGAARRAGRMGIIRKYAVELALVLAVIYVYAPLSLEYVAELRWLDDISVIVSKSLAPAKPVAGVSLVDPIAAANCRRGPGLSNCPTDEIDRRMALVLGRSSGWPPCGAPARSELDKLLPVERPHVPAVAQASNGGRSDAKTPSEDSSPDRLSPRSEVASDEICKRDEERLGRLSKSPTSDEAIRFLTELRCEKLRPELFRLREHLDYQASSAAVAAQSHPSIVAEAGVAGRRATEPQNKTHWRVSSRGPQARRHANRRAAPNLPPILLALFGEAPRNSTVFQRTRISGGPSGGRGGVSGGGAAGGVASAASASGGGSGGGGGSASGGSSGSGSGGGSGGGGGGSGGGGSGRGSGGGSGGGGEVPAGAMAEVTAGGNGGGKRPGTGGGPAEGTAGDRRLRERRGPAGATAGAPPHYVFFFVVAALDASQTERGERLISTPTADVQLLRSLRD